MRWTTITSVAVATLLAVTGCSEAGSTGPPDAGEPTASPDADAWPDSSGRDSSPGGDVPMARPVQFGLQPVDSCDALLDHFVTNALDHVTPWGLGGHPEVFLGDVDVAAEEAARSEASADTAAADAAVTAGEDQAFSTTNVQEAGVDEPDVVKTDGQLMVLARDQRVVVVDAVSSEVVGRVAIGDDLHDLQLLMDGDDLLVLARRGLGGGPVPMEQDLVPAFSPARTELVRVDLADPATPRVVGSTTIEGTIRSARMIDGTVRVVVESQPVGLSLTHPDDNGLAAEQDALDENRDRIRESDVDDWIPHRRSTTTDGADGDVERLVDCDDMAVPATFSGFATLSVVTMTIGDTAMAPTSSAAVVASGETVYASSDRLIVATSPWGRWRIPFVAADVRAPDAEVSTDLHSFDISDPTTTTFVGSGQVPGVLVNQFALSEVGGTVRVATTMQPAWWGGGGQSESALVVLRERDGALEEVGRVDGLGLTERIYAVRYLSPDLAAIVTFRETDPLYLVDTSDPTDPEVTGELKIPGFSTYLHPIGDGRLVGIGQDADERGRTLGLQLSLFDVSDPSSPERVDQVTFGSGHSTAEHDHHAFLWWAPSGRVVVPAELYPRDEWVTETGEDVAPSPSEPVIAPDKPFVGILSVDVDGTSLAAGPRATLSDRDGDPWRGWVERTLVIGDDLWSLGADTLARHDLQSLEVEQRIDLR